MQRAPSRRHDRGATALNPTQARATTRRPPAASRCQPSRVTAGRRGGARWGVGLVAVIATIELAMASDAFVLRPLLTHGDPRGVVRLAVIVGAFALAAQVRLRPHGSPNLPADDAGTAAAPERDASPAPDPPADGPLPAPRRWPRIAAAEVQVLGPIAIRGGAHRLTMKSVELVAYLACHPEGVHEERIKAALWPARAPRPQTWRNRLSTTRKGLGCSAGGAPLLPRFDRHVGRLDAAVHTDVETLVAARAQAEHETTTAAATTLAQALELVRGRPFDVATGFAWAVAERHVAHAERVVEDVAHELATLTLKLGDWRRARWATDVGLRAYPTSELLYQDRMRASAAGGDLGGIEPAMRDLPRTLATTDSSDVPSRHTVELSQHLHGCLQHGAPTSPGRVTPSDAPRH